VGEARGRNSKIAEKLRRPGIGDGTANLGGKNGTGTSRQPGGMIDGGGQDIWARGGEKRVRRE
jgi:hypothetical protein